MSFLSLLAKLGLDGSGFKAGLKEADVAAKNFGKDLKQNLSSSIASAFSATAFIGFIAGTVNAMKRIKDLSDQAGVTTDEMQEMDQAAKDVGLRFEDVAKSLGRIGEARKKAASDQGVRSIFESFGIAWDRVNDSGINNLTIEREMLQNMSKMNLGMRERAEFAELVGVKFEKLLGIVSEMDNHKVSLFSKEDLDAVDKLEENLARILKMLQVAASPVVGNVSKIIDPGSTWKERVNESLHLGKNFLNNATGRWWWGKKNKAEEPRNFESGINEHSTGGGTSKEKISDRDIIAEERHKLISEAYNKLADTALALEISRMDAGEKRLETEREINDLMEARRGYAKGDIEFAVLGAEINKKTMELEALRNPRLGADSMQAVGNQLGNAARLNSGIQIQNPHVQIAQKQLSVQMAMQAHLAIIAAACGHSAAKTTQHH